MTDHRTEAEHWLREAQAIFDEPGDHDDPPIDQMRIVSRALIGIGHALLDTPSGDLERRMEALAQLFTAGGSMPTAAAVRTALRGDDQPDWLES